MMSDIVLDPAKCDFARYLEDQSFLEAQSIKPAASFADEVADLASNGDSISGAVLPWKKTAPFIRIGDGKLSIWAGVNGSGKSLLLGQVIAGLMQQGRTAVVASLEMHPRQTLYRMICQGATCKAGREYSLAWLGYFTGRLYIYDQLDRIAADRVLGMAHYAANELGAKDIVIDSMTKCGVGREDYTAQAAFVDRLQWCAKRWNVHIHLVCHMRKSNAPGHQEGKNDIRGAAEITDLADNVFILRRNKDKEKQVALRDASLPYDEETILQPCAVLAVEKNRDYGHEPDFCLWYHHDSGQFMESHNMPYPALEMSL